MRRDHPPAKVLALWTATEVFPKAYRDDQELAGLATAIGLVLALRLDQLG